MTSPQAAKGARAERELASLLSDQLGVVVQRRRNLGTHEDIGDLIVPGWTVEVKNYADLATGINVGLKDLEREQANAGTTFGVCFVRRRGGRWIAVMDLPQIATVIRETLP